MRTICETQNPNLSESVWYKPTQIFFPCTGLKKIAYPNFSADRTISFCAFWFSRANLPSFIERFPDIKILPSNLFGHYHRPGNYAVLNFFQAPDVPCQVCSESFRWKLGQKQKWMWLTLGQFECSFVDLSQSCAFEFARIWPLQKKWYEAAFLYFLPFSLWKVMS